MYASDLTPTFSVARRGMLSSVFLSKGFGFSNTDIGKDIGNTWPIPLLPE